MRTRLAVFVAGFGLLLSAWPALAHHAFAAEYDAKKPIKLTGTVTKLEWANPHTWFYVDVKDDSGNVTNWGFEMGSPNVLLRAGWTRNSMKSGDVVTVEGSRARDGSNNGNVKTVTLASTGQRLFAASSQGQ
jgi:DNA/RNA endonuclease YhcR with UshA esterase domain